LRLHLLVLASLTLLACAGGTTTGDSGTPADSGASDTDTDTDVLADPYDDRDEVLIFHGRGGVGPEGAWGYVTHDETIAQLEPEGLVVEHKDSWPSNTGRTRLVLLPLPGFDDEGDFSASEISGMESIMDAGGVVVIEGDNGATVNPAVINTLLEGLGASMRAEYVDQSFPAGGAAHPLADGVETLGIQASGSIAPHDDTCLVAHSGGSCHAAVRSYGDGYLVLLHDSQILDNYDTWEGNGYDNKAFLWNLTRLGWELGDGGPPTE